MFGYQANVSQGRAMGSLCCVSGDRVVLVGFAWSHSVHMIWEVTLPASCSQLSLGSEATISTLEAANQTESMVQLCVLPTPDG